MVAVALSRHSAVAAYDERAAYPTLMGHASVPTTDRPYVGYEIPRWTDLLPGPHRAEADQKSDGEWV